jgi:amino acid permease
LCLINLILILGVLAICEYQLYKEGRPITTQTFAFATDLSFSSMSGALTNILYAFAGHWLYFELIAVMRVPEHFPRVFVVNAPLQLLLYLLVACTGYYYQGQVAEGYFLDNLPQGGL